MTRLRPFAVDLALAAGLAAVAAGGVLSEVLESHRPTPPLIYALLLAVASGALLCWRRRAPLAVTVGIGVLCLGYHLLGYPGLATAVPLVAAVYAAAALPVRSRLAVAVALLVAVAVIPVLPPHPASFDVGALFGPPIAMVGVAVLGEAARVRRVAAERQLDATRRAAEQEQLRHRVEERLDIARELHDVLAHTITVISIQAAVAAEAVDDRPDDARGALTAVRAAARDAMTELRGTLTALRGTATPTAPQPGLPGIGGLVDNARGAGLTVDFAAADAPEHLPSAVGLALYRIVQEGLTNTLRHSAAGVALVRTSYPDGTACVEVLDPGPASTTATNDGTSTGTGHGLAGMRERVDALGGTLDAGPTSGGGFRVAAVLPLREDR